MYDTIENKHLHLITNGKLVYNDTAKILSMEATNVTRMLLSQKNQNEDYRNQQEKQKRQYRVVVVTAGTTDIPVAEEAAYTLEVASTYRNNTSNNSNIDATILVDRVYDCGVAGLHRIVDSIPILTNPHVCCIIVCAGMDGALPSVVGGLVSVPVIAVPTSVGYGASFHGISALLTMLNTCSPGVSVVNIDNGFGAATIVYKMIVKMMEREKQT